jgi:hypothetical protein
MMEETKRKTVKWGALLPGVFLVSALALVSRPAASTSDRQKERR